MNKHSLSVVDLAAQRILYCGGRGPIVAGAADCDDLLTAAWAAEVARVAIARSRLSDEFFHLATGVAGAIVQRFGNYRLGLAIIGDIHADCRRYPHFADLVAEANRGEALWFCHDVEALAQRLSAQAAMHATA